MKVTTADGKTFTLTSEGEADRQLIDAMDLVRHIAFVAPQRVRVQERSCWVNQGCTLLIALDSPQKLVADTAREALKALGQLVSLGLREAANQVHPSGLATNPDLQESLSALCVQLQAVLQGGVAGVGQSEVVGQELVGHGESSNESQSIAQRAKTAKLGGAA